MLISPEFKPIFLSPKDRNEKLLKFARQMGLAAYPIYTDCNVIEYICVSAYDLRYIYLPSHYKTSNYLIQLKKPKISDFDKMRIDNDFKKRYDELGSLNDVSYEYMMKHCTPYKYIPVSPDSKYRTNHFFSDYFKDLDLYCAPICSEHNLIHYEYMIISWQHPSLPIPMGYFQYIDVIRFSKENPERFKHVESFQNGKRVFTYTPQPPKEKTNVVAFPSLERPK